MSKTIRLEIITPEGKAFSDDVDEVVFQTMVGEIGVLPGHTPLMTSLKEGEICFTKSGVETKLKIGSGFAKVTGDSVNIATNAMAEAASDDEVIDAARRRAEQTLAEKIAPEEQATVEASLQKALQPTIRRRPRSAPSPTDPDQMR